MNRLATGAGRSGGPPPDGPLELSPRRRLLIMLVVGLGSVMSAVDIFIVNVAIPSLRHNLHADSGQVELVVTAYTMTYAVLLITGGRLGDLFGRVRVYLIGLAVFTLASAACGSVTSPTLLIVCRVIQAAGAAVMVPQAYAVVQRVFDPAERVRAISILSTAGSIGVVFAQVVGGALIQLDPFHLGWRVVFFVNVPIGVGAIVLGRIVLPTQRPERTSRLDIPGAALGTLSLLLFVVPMVEGRDLGWPPWLLGALAASPVAVASFIWLQRRSAAAGRAPLVELSLFRRRSMSAGIPLVALSQLSNSGCYFLLSIYLQQGRGLSPGLAGLAFAPNAVAYMALAHLSPRVARRWGRRTIAFGYTVIAAAFLCAVLVLRIVGPRGSPFDLMPAMALVGAGQAFVNAPLFSTVLSETPRGHEGSASGILTTMSQSGSAIGVAFLGLVFFTALGGNAGITGRLPPAAATSAFATSLTVNVAICVLCVGLVRLLPSFDRLYGPRTDEGSGDPERAGPDPTLVPAPEGTG